MRGFLGNKRTWYYAKAKVNDVYKVNRPSNNYSLEIYIVFRFYVEVSDKGTVKKNTAFSLRDFNCSIKLI